MLIVTCWCTLSLALALFTLQSMMSFCDLGSSYAQCCQYQPSHRLRRLGVLNLSRIGWEDYSYHSSTHVVSGFRIEVAEVRDALCPKALYREGNAVPVFENGVNSNSFVDLSGSERHANIQRLKPFFSENLKNTKIRISKCKACH